MWNDIKLKTEVTFDAAHRLPFHKGQCSNLHGHTWRAVIEVYAMQRLLGVNIFPDALVLDFGHIKQLVRDKYDHRVLISASDVGLGALLEDFLPEGNVIFLENDTTAENLAYMITRDVCQVLRERVDEGLALLEKANPEIYKKMHLVYAQRDPTSLYGVDVTLYETPKNSASTSEYYTPVLKPELNSCF